MKENTTIITGASSGIGRELAFRLADKGAWLTLASRNRERLESVAVRCRELGGKAFVVQTDVSDESQCKNLIERSLGEYGRIDTLVNNAGYGMRAKLEQLQDLERWRAVIETNLMGSVYCTFHALPHIRKTRGRIVGVSSVVGKFASPGNTAYCASKFAMAGFFDALRLEVMEEGVSVISLYPGLIVSEFAERIEDPAGNPLGETGKKIYSPKTMTSEQASRIIYAAIKGRKRDMVITRDGKIAVWLSKNFPSFFDKLTLSFYRGRKKKAAAK